MASAIQWFLFGMFVWGCCVVMSAVARRWAPEMWDHGSGDGSTPAPPKRPAAASRDGGGEDPRDAELRDLRKRVETLETIVTDRRYQWEQEFRSPK